VLIDSSVGDFADAEGQIFAGLDVEFWIVFFRIDMSFENSF
jgi:hypothetical protein